MTASPVQSPLAAELAELARTLGNAHRLILLEHIAQGERPERLAELSGLARRRAGGRDAACPQEPLARCPAPGAGG